MYASPAWANLTPPMSYPSYRLFFDESMSRSAQDEDGPMRYFALCGCVFFLETYRQRFRPAVQELVTRYFPDHDPEEPVILHRYDIKNRRGSFAPLQQEQLRLAFDQDVLRLFETSDYDLMTVVLDKELFFARYGPAADPHVRCLWELLGGYCGFLKMKGKTGDVLGEARKQHLDKPLMNAYRAYCQREEVKPLPLSSGELKLKPKEQNIVGTQFADLLAYPAMQSILFQAGLVADAGAFTKQIWERIAAKHVPNMAKVIEP